MHWEKIGYDVLWTFDVYTGIQPRCEEEEQTSDIWKPIFIGSQFWLSWLESLLNSMYSPQNFLAMSLLQCKKESFLQSSYKIVVIDLFVFWEDVNVFIVM